MDCRGSNRTKMYRTKQKTKKFKSMASLHDAASDFGGHMGLWIVYRQITVMLMVANANALLEALHFHWNTWQYFLIKKLPFKWQSKWLETHFAIINLIGRNWLVLTNDCQCVVPQQKKTAVLQTTTRKGCIQMDCTHANGRRLFRCERRITDWMSGI